MLPGNNDEARFGHLLKPIRDLTKNWQVDIATQLEDYLSEIGTVRISFDGGHTSMNFAEAALLIQGSACVYSKKVEFLYTMVYQTLDALASKKKQQQQASSVDAEGNDADATMAYDKSREEFLSLDDIPAAKNVNMKPEDNHGGDKSVQVAVRTPLSLVKDDLDRGIPLINRKGETVAYRKDFNLNSDSYHLTGTMMPDPVHYSLLEQSLMRHPASTPVVVTGGNAMEEDDNLIPDIPEDENDNKGPALDNSLDDVDMGDVFDGFNNSMDDIKEEVGRGGLRPQRRPLNVVQFKVEKKDPWETYNPDEPSTEKDKPYKKGRRFRLPPSLAKGRKRKRTVEKKPLLPLTDFISKAYYSHASKLPANPIKVPSHPEFEDAFWVVYKKHEANLRKEKALLMKQGKQEEEAEEYVREDPPPEDIFPGAGEVEDDIDPLDGFDADSDDVVVGGGMDIQPDMFSQNSAQELVTDYENLVRGYVEAYMANAEQYAQMTDLAKRVQQWEDKLNPILKKEEEQGFFDIHDYGTKVLERLEECSKTGRERISFSEVVSDSVNYDISRMFLASLQLANNYNVDVSASDQQGEARVDTMKLKLLTKTRHHEEMAEYKAPSVQ